MFSFLLSPSSARLAMRTSPRRFYFWLFSQWIPEPMHYVPGVPIILVGTKLDLRDDKQFFIDHPSAVPITTNQVPDSLVISLCHDDHFVMRHVMNDAVYSECSSKTQHNVKTVFDAAIKLVLQPRKQKKTKIMNRCAFL